MFKKHKKTIIIVVVILLILVLAYFNRKKSQTTAPGAPSSTGTTIPISGYTQTSCTENTVLKKGIQCDAVKSAQNLINSRRFLYAISPALTIDGKFGSKTEAAFQKILDKKTATLTELQNSI